MNNKSLNFSIKEVENRVIKLHGQMFLLDKDIAELYDVETKRINEAVKNNPDKFPQGYITELSESEKKELVENFDRFKNIKHSSVAPKAFSEKAVYMLATILKSPRATQTTLSIIETFAKLRELSRTIHELSEQKDKAGQQSLLEKGGEIISDLLGEDLNTIKTESEFELNFAVLKVKHKVTRKSPKK